MNHEARESEERQFVEDMGFFFEEYHLPRMAGRIVGWLLISDPPYQSIGDLSDRLQASKGSMSTMIRLLMQLNLVERTRLPGMRRDVFRMKFNRDELLRRTVSQLGVQRQLTERALALIEDRNPEMRQQLERMRDLSAFLEVHIPSMLKRWEEERGKVE